jgi:hypothetical protein
MLIANRGYYGKSFLRLRTGETGYVTLFDGSASVVRGRIRGNDAPSQSGTTQLERRTLT